MLDLSVQTSFHITLLYLATLGTAITCLAYVRWHSLWEQKFSHISRFALWIATFGLLFATLYPFGTPAGIEPQRFTADPFLGIRQMLHLARGVDDTNVTSAWAFANLFLLWPLAAALSVFVGLKKNLLILFLLIVTLEVTQGVVWQLGRSFEIADIFSNMLGAIIFLTVAQKISKASSTTS